VAVKVPSPEYTQEPNFIEAFIREAKLMARLSHPHILPFYDFFEHANSYYMVTKYVPTSLGDRLGQPLSLPETFDFIEQIAAALDYCHAQNIIHCDVKPTNILLDEQNRLYLSDFGLARMVNPGQLTHASTGAHQHGWHLPVDVWPAVYALKFIVGELFTGQIPYAGTPEYISPEQGRGAPVDARTDVYALGIILFEMLTGQVPYQADTDELIVLKHITHPIPHPSQINPQGPKEVDQVVVKALAKDPDHRFASAGELASALHQTILHYQQPLLAVSPEFRP
jgi:serine/threonine protein kinase